MLSDAISNYKHAHIVTVPIFKAQHQTAFRRVNKQNGVCTFFEGEGDEILVLGRENEINKPGDIEKI